MIDLLIATLVSLSRLTDEEEEPCVVPAGSKTPGQDCEKELGLARKIRNVFFEVFVVFKCVSFAYKLIWMALKYKRTYGTLSLPEVWIILLTLLKVTILIPNYFIIEINTLFVVFLLNSYCSYFLTYIFA